ncbi:hypothetical protein [Nonomuraea maritima]|uniref:hypothetical protein n=1 Tax=Nonomuraea maritima TaxID=683260 RepID=UPI0037191846
MKLDITRTNQAIEHLLETTESPRHRFLLQADHRHRYLEIAGRYRDAGQCSGLQAGGKARAGGPSGPSVP